MWCVSVYVWWGSLSQRLHVVTPGNSCHSTCDNWLKLTTGLELYELSTGCHPMAPLRSYQACSPAEDLQTSRAEPSFYAYRAKKRRKYSVWNLAT